MLDRDTIGYMFALLKKPSAWIPILLSLCAYVLFALYFLHMLPPDPIGDEGLGAHLFWLLMGLQIPIGLFFAAKWLPREPRPAFTILALQTTLWLLAWTPVWYFHL